MIPATVTETIAAECEILDSDRIRVGNAVLSVAAGDRGLLPGGGALPRLWREIYWRYHLRQATAEPEVRRIPVLRNEEDPAFASELCLANAGKGWWAVGWRSLGNSRVSNGRVTLVASDEEIRSIGAGVMVRFPPALPYISAGYYVAVSDAGPPQELHGGNVRLYANVGAAHASAVLQALTGFLADQQLPGVVKILNNPKSFGRSDSCVIYLERSGWDYYGDSLVNLLRNFLLSEPVSAFALRIIDGLGFAEEDARGGRRTVASFGEIRSRLAAEGLAAAFNSGTGEGESARAAGIRAAFYGSGLDPDQPYRARLATS
ncbi:T3SS effector HopA1 family protein [Mesorhizobium mediterraneum]|uniref:T3SS effector HopA1 family protein n=1 Tax=Mesorhizobium mediterraneum TaxID=43617 RepID=UPI001780410B|nr:T3SS effector HopA1 family protein [Mesorhizobium mediterraneum]